MTAVIPTSDTGNGNPVGLDDCLSAAVSSDHVGMMMMMMMMKLPIYQKHEITPAKTVKTENGPISRGSQSEMSMVRDL